MQIDNLTIENVLPADIERRSFEIITKELAEKGLAVDPRYEHIVKHIKAHNLVFHYRILLGIRLKPDSLL